MEPNVNGSRVSRKSKHAHHSKPYDRDERSKRHKTRRNDESTGFFGVLKSTVERLFTYKPHDDNISESENEETDMSENEPEYHTELPKLLPPPPPAPTADITGDIIARAIENRRDISVVEYEYYNKLLKDRLQQQQQQQLMGFEPRSPAFSRNVMTPNDIMRHAFTPETSSLKRNARAVSPKEEVAQEKTVEVSKPPPKRRVYEEVPPVSETTKRILSTLDNMSSPLQDARSKPPPVYKTVKPITEFTPRKLEKVSMPVPSKPAPAPVKEAPLPVKLPPPVIQQEEEEEEEEIPLPKTKKNKSKKKEE